MNEKSHPHFTVAEKQSKRTTRDSLSRRERIQHTSSFPTRTLSALRCCSALVSWLTLSLFLALVAFVSRSSAAASEKVFQFAADNFVKIPKKKI